MFRLNFSRDKCGTRKHLYHTTLFSIGKWLPMDFFIILIIADFTAAQKISVQQTPIRTPYSIHPIPTIRQYLPALLYRSCPCIDPFIAKYAMLKW